MFRCFECNREAFIIRGLCDICAPALHGSYKAAMNAVSDMTDSFERETGKKALYHWYEYEEWAANQSNFAEYAKTVIDHEERTTSAETSSYCVMRGPKE